MRLYLIKGTVNEVERALQFCGTLADSGKAIKAYQAMPVYFTDVYREDVDIPTDKKGLMQWLNEYTLDTEGMI